MTRRVDTVVIGAGAMGSATAWWLAREGRDVVVAEQFEQGHVRGSSHGGVRIFRLAYPDLGYVQMAQEALHLWREAEADTGATLLELTGAYDHGPSQFLDAIAEPLAEAGARTERLSPAAAHERVPGLRFDTDVLFHADAGRCFADRTVRTLQDRVAELGGDVRFECRAQLRVVGDEVEVLLGDDEVVRAGTVVVTAGGWVAPLLEAAGSPVPLPPLTVTQEQVVHFEPLDAATAWPSFIHHVFPYHYGLHTPGQGLKIGGHHEGPPTTADDRTFELDDAGIARIGEYVRQWVPGVDPTPQFGATCLYTNTPDESFVLERVGPVVVGSPCSGHGFKFTPLIGRRLATLAQLP